MSWDEYYHNLCIEVGKNTKCMSREIGTVLVRDKTIISAGYNGPPRSVPHCNERYVLDLVLRGILEKKGINPDDKKVQSRCPRQVMGFKSGEGLDWCIAGHAERNALINAAREGHCTKGTTLYMSCGVPCTPCLIEILNSGVEEIVITKMTFYDVSAKYLLENSNLKCRIFEHLK